MMFFLSARLGLQRDGLKVRVGEWSDPRRFCGLMAVTVLTVLVPFSSARAEESAWWSLASGSRPANLQTVALQDEIQSVTVTAAGGEFTLKDEATGQSADFAYNASKSIVEAGLQKLYGAGNVKVSGGPGSETGAKPYIVSFVGELADRPIALIKAEGKQLVAGTAGKSVVVAEVEAGVNGGEIIVTAQNLGDTNVEGNKEPIVLHDVLPQGVQGLFIEGVAGEDEERPEGNRGPVSCQLATLTCEFEGSLHAYEQIEVRIGVGLEPGAHGENTVSVAGGGVSARTLSRPIKVGGASAFGIENYEIIPENVGGGIDAQAGSHPFQFTTNLSLNQNSKAEPVALPKDLYFELPAGFAANPTPFVQCTDEQFSKAIEINGEKLPNECPASSAVGVVSVTLNEPGLGGLDTVTTPLFNLAPLVGEPARFGFKVANVAPAFIDTAVDPEEGYRVIASSKDISEIGAFLSAKVTFWGVPGEHAHDGQRGWQCLDGSGSCQPLSQTETPPLLLMPSLCEEPFASTASGDSWSAPGVPSLQAPRFTYALPVGHLVGCNQLPFEPSISVAPDTSWANTPTGLTVKLHVPQEASLNPSGLSEATVRNTTVILPPGLTINPGGADGLEACSENEVGYLPGLSVPPNSLTFSSNLNILCPEASKIGVAQIKTPLLPNKLEGAVYLASQNANPFGSLIAMYMVLSDPVSGTVIKLAGEVELSSSGQIVTIFKNTPPLPFEDLELTFLGGARAPLSTPSQCGSYDTLAQLTSWAEPSTGIPASTFSRFQIDKGPDNGPCANPQPFSPQLQAGSTNVQAGAFSQFITTLNRPDSSQALGGLSLKLPPGLLGTLSAVTLCGEPQASQGTCSSNSLIGHTTVSAGLGSNPVTVKEPGKVFLTGPYDGAPFGLSIVNPVAAGPFDLEKGTPCDCIVVRAKVEIDPLTSQLTIVSDPLPTIIDGIPLQIQHVNVTIDRPDFTFNPTNCEHMKIEGEVASSEGAHAAVSTPLQVTNCAALSFKPEIKVTTAGKTSRAKGASLVFQLAYPKEPFGTQANIAKAKVDLPKQLPSRLKTLQKACTAAVFNTNPANCPTAAKVGTVKVITPVVPVPLTGPAYFVSYGSLKFPELVFVLQGYGITVYVHAETFISKAGITSSTLRAVPDVPFNTFTLTLPEGPYSALAANGNLCKTKLQMPVSFTAQNGMTQHKTVKITPTNCPKTKTKTKNKHRSAPPRK